MIYYRIAGKNTQSSLWQWKSTKLTSLVAVFHFLRIYSAIPQDHLRVFSSSSYECLEELLADENKGWGHYSITSEQFLRERGIHSGSMAAGASQESGGGAQENHEKRTITATLPPLLSQSRPRDISLDEKPIDTLNKKRYELETGAGGDHDVPYTFTLPLSLPQTLAWIRLMNKVQRGKLEP